MQERQKLCYITHSTPLCFLSWCCPFSPGYSRPTQLENWSQVELLERERLSTLPWCSSRERRCFLNCRVNSICTNLLQFIVIAQNSDVLGTWEDERMYKGGALEKDWPFAWAVCGRQDLSCSSGLGMLRRSSQATAQRRSEANPSSGKEGINAPGSGRMEAEEPLAASSSSFARRNPQERAQSGQDHF